MGNRWLERVNKNKLIDLPIKGLSSFFTPAVYTSTAHLHLPLLLVGHWVEHTLVGLDTGRIMHWSSGHRGQVLC